MSFTSYLFGIFFAILFLIYWQIPVKYKPALLLTANYIFYMSFDIRYLFVLFFLTIFSYFGALQLQKSQKAQKKLVFFGLCLLLITILCLYKAPSLSLIAPLGISYYTFQAISYLVDVYKNKITAETNFLHYAVYLSFFPLLLSGPIERAEHILPQLHLTSPFDYSNTVKGIERLLWGYFKKLVIADNLAVYVNTIGNNISEYQGFVIFLAALGYTLQLYCDFSGYSDMAIGFSQMLNIHINENFKSPYFSASIKEFWSRWHISLSSWLKDYLYIPLGGNRCSKIRSSFNLLATFLISGLWHGVGTKYLIWGGIHGILQITERFLPASWNSLHIDTQKTSVKQTILTSLKIAVTFMILIFTWLPFWLPTTRDFIYAITHMFTGCMQPYLYLQSGIAALGITTYSSIVLLAALIVLFIHDYMTVKTRTYDIVFPIQSKITPWLRIALLLFILCCNCVAGKSFIYFQF